MALFNTTKPVGIDVSYWDVGTGNPIDWSQVSNHATFAICKLTEGWSYPSNPETKEKLKANLVGAKNAGLQVGAYHYFIASLDPVKQADNFIRAITESGVDLDIPPVVDIEKHPYYANPSREVAITNIRKFLNELEAWYGIKPMIYTGAWYWDSVIGDTDWAKDYPLWTANYLNDPQCDLDSRSPCIPIGWTDWKFWQFTSNAEFPGVYPSREDANLFNGTLDDLKAFCGLQPPEPVDSDLTVKVTELEEKVLEHTTHFYVNDQVIENLQDQVAKVESTVRQLESLATDSTAKLIALNNRINSVNSFAEGVDGVLADLLDRINKAKAVI